MSRRITQIVFLPPFVVAAAETCGAFRRRDLTVETIRTRSSREQADRLLDGSADVAVTAIDNLFAWNQRPGADLVAIAQVERITWSPIYLRKGLADLGALTRLARLRLLVDAPDSGFVLALRAIVEGIGVARDRYDLVPVGGPLERFAALAAGEGDAAMLAPHLGVRAAYAGLVAAGTLEDHYPDFPGLGVVARRVALADADGVVDAYRRALVEAVAWIGADPARAAAALRDVEGAAADLPYCAATPSVSRPGFERLVAIRRSLAMLPSGAFGYADLVAAVARDDRAA